MLLAGVGGVAESKVRGLQGLHVAVIILSCRSQW